MVETKLKMEEIVQRYKYLLAGIVGLILFFSVRGCVNKQSDILADLKAKSEQVEKLKDGLAVGEKNRLRQRDSINIENDKKEKYILSLKDRISESENKVSSLETEAKTAKEKIKNFSYVESAKEFNSIYKTNNAEAVNTGVNLKNNLPNLVLETISDANFAQDIIKEKNKQLFAKDTIIQNKDSQLKNSSVLLVSAEKNLEASRQLNGLQTDLNNDLEKQNKNLKHKNTWNKILVPIAAVIGIVIGVQTSK